LGACEPEGESCCTGSGLLVEKGVNLETGLEKRESVRMANKGVGMGGIVYIVVWSERREILWYEEQMSVEDVEA